MFDNAARQSVSPTYPVASDIQFISIEVLPTADGLLCVSATATSVDEANLEFINDDMGSVRVSSLDDAVAAIRASISSALYPHTHMEVG